MWGWLVNTDFSAMVKKNGNLNTKNHGVWSRSLAEAGDLVEFVQEKFEDSFMVWGGISLKGLILTNSVLLAFSFFIISPFKFHQIRHPGTVLNAELHEDFKTGITFRI